MSEYVVIFEQADDGGWGAYLPDLPGMVALGASRAEVADGIQEALSAYADDLHQRGGSVPPPHHVAGTVAAQPLQRRGPMAAVVPEIHMTGHVARSLEQRRRSQEAPS